MNDAVFPTIKDTAGRFKAAFDELLGAHLTALTTRYHTAIPHPALDALFTHLHTVAKDGKRLRPFFTYQLYATTNPNTTPANLHELLLAIELFHIFCLIHDDVMDEAPLRHSAPTLHNYASETLYRDSAFPATRRRAGESQAILIGDIVFGEVMRLLYQSPQVTKIAPIAELFHTLIEEVCLGQMLDIDLTTRTGSSVGEIEQKNRLKTAYYSCVRPLQIGALLAGRSPILPLLAEYGEAVGVLYQIQDDLLDVVGDSADTKKTTLTDVAQNQHTLLSAHVRERGGEAATLLNAHVGRTLTEHEATIVRQLFIDSGAVAFATKRITELEHKARTVLQNPLFLPEECAFLSDILTLLTGRRA